MLFRKINLPVQDVVLLFLPQSPFRFGETVPNSFWLFIIYEIIDFLTVAAIFVIVIDVCSLKVTILAIFLGVTTVMTSSNNLTLPNAGETNWVKNAPSPLWWVRHKTSLYCSRSTLLNRGRQLELVTDKKTLWKNAVHQKLALSQLICSLMFMFYSQDILVKYFWPLCFSSDFWTIGT